MKVGTELDSKVPVFDGLSAGQKVVTGGALLLQAIVQPRRLTCINKLTAQVLRNRPVVVALLIVFILAGINAYEQLPVEAYPDVSNLRVQVQTLWPGHAAEEVERK